MISKALSLLSAVGKGDLTSTRLLLDSGIDPNFLSGKLYKIALRNGDVSMVRLLVDYDLDGERNVAKVGKFLNAISGC